MQEDLGLDPQQSYESLGGFLCRHSQHCGVGAEAGGWMGLAGGQPSPRISKKSVSRKREREREE